MVFFVVGIIVFVFIFDFFDLYLIDYFDIMLYLIEICVLVFFMGVGFVINWLLCW